MADDTIETTPPNERIAFIEAELGRTRAKHAAATERVSVLAAQVTALEAQLETEYGKLDPEPESSVGED